MTLVLFHLPLLSVKILTKKEDGSYLRTINSFKELFDVSPVYKEAYPDTSVALRKMQDLESEDLKDYFARLRVN